MSIESAGSSRHEHSLFSGLTNEEVFERANATIDLGELKKLRILIINRAIFDEDDELANGIAVFITQKIEDILQQELDDILFTGQQTKDDAEIIKVMERQFNL